MILATLKIVDTDLESGFRIINANDFNAETDAEFADTPDPEGAKKVTVAELRDALTAKGIEIPEGAKKAELQALLDAPVA